MKRQLLCLLLLLPVMAWADDSGQCGDNVTWKYVEATHTLTISGTGAMKNIGATWHQYDIVTVVIENGVTAIANWAFDGCRSLTSVTIPESVTAIGNFAFWYCSGLTSITIPDGVTTIGDNAFEKCSGLTSVTIPDGVTTIGNNAFWDCI